LYITYTGGGSAGYWNAWRREFQKQYKTKEGQRFWDKLACSDQEYKFGPEGGLAFPMGMSGGGTPDFTTALQRAFASAARQRGRSGDDSAHHAIAVREFGKNVDMFLGPFAGYLSALGAAAAGNYVELSAPSPDAVQDTESNLEGIFYYQNGTTFTYEQ